jgi:hypothetical protein
LKTFILLIYFCGLKKRLDSSFVNKDEKEEKKEALDSWIESTEED